MASVYRVLTKLLRVNSQPFVVARPYALRQTWARARHLQKRHIVEGACFVPLWRKKVEPCVDGGWGKSKKLSKALQTWLRPSSLISSDDNLQAYVMRNPSLDHTDTFTGGFFPRWYTTWCGRVTARSRELVLLAETSLSRNLASAVHNSITSLTEVSRRLLCSLVPLESPMIVPTGNQTAWRCTAYLRLRGQTVLESLKALFHPS